VIVGTPLLGFRRHDGTQLSMDEVERFHVACSAGHHDRALDRCHEQHGQLLCALAADAVGLESATDELGPLGECGSGPVDHRRVVRLDGDGHHRTACAVVGFDEQPAESVHDDVDGGKTVLGLGHPGGGVLGGVVDGFTQELGATAGKVVVCGTAWCAAVLEHVGDGGRMRTAFPDEQRGRDHHSFTRTDHPSIPSARYVEHHTYHSGSFGAE